MHFAFKIIIEYINKGLFVINTQAQRDVHSFWIRSTETLIKKNTFLIVSAKKLRQETKLAILRLTKLCYRSITWAFAEAHAQRSYLIYIFGAASFVISSKTKSVVDVSHRIVNVLNAVLSIALYILKILCK